MSPINDTFIFFLDSLDFSDFLHEVRQTWITKSIAYFEILELRVNFLSYDISGYDIRPNLIKNT